VITTQDVVNRARELEVEASVLPANRENAALWGVARVAFLLAQRVEALEAELQKLKVDVEASDRILNERTEHLV
jgi:hypothetical protein